jgi:hypothetical protein
MVIFKTGIWQPIQESDCFNPLQLKALFQSLLGYSWNHMPNALFLYILHANQTGITDGVKTKVVLHNMYMYLKTWNKQTDMSSIQQFQAVGDSNYLRY